MYHNTHTHTHTGIHTYKHHDILLNTTHTMIPLYMCLAEPCGASEPRRGFRGPCIASDIVGCGNVVVINSKLRIISHTYNNSILKYNNKNKCHFADGGAPGRSSSR